MSIRGLWIVLCCLGPVAISAQVTPNGPEFQVNTYVNFPQRRPAVALDSEGNFVVVWESSDSNGTDSDPFSVQARIFDADGTARTDDLQVNTYTTSIQWWADVAAAPQGDFVVVWTSFPGGGGTDPYGSVQARRFDSAGNPLGDEFQVNSQVFGYQRVPAIAADAQGGFVVVWSSFVSYSPDTTYSIQAQRFDPAGAPLGAEFQVNTFTTYYQVYPDVAMDAGGNFVVVWQSFGSPGTDTDFGILARRYDSSGNPLGTEFQVNTYTTAFQKYPTVAVAPNGDFLVVWQGASASDPDSSGILAQRFDSAGSPVGGEFQVNSYTTDDQTQPSAAVDAHGRFVIAWQSLGSNGPDPFLNSIQARRYDQVGNPLGAEFQVNTFGTNNQSLPAIAADPMGDCVVTWMSLGSFGTDHSFESIQAQRYDGLFRDGVESGDTSRWSRALP